MKQCTNLKAKENFQLKRPKGRPCCVKVGNVFWVTSPEYLNTTSVIIQRDGKGSIGEGYRLPLEAVLALFEVIQDD